MPVVRFDVTWPDTTIMRCQSPSTVILDFLLEGQPLPLQEFMIRIERGLDAASDRVRQKYGFACSAAADQLDIIQAKAQEFKHTPTAVVQITKIY